MTFAELLDAIRVHDVKLDLRLVVSTPPGVMTPELRATLAEHKPHLLAKLGRDAQWEALSRQRWGPARDDPTPGIVVDRPDPSRAKAAIEGADPNDRYVLAERVAIREENLPDDDASGSREPWAIQPEANGVPPATSPRPPCPNDFLWRKILTWWPIPLREQWGRLANRYGEEEGVKPPHSEWKAFLDVVDEINAAQARGEVIPFTYPGDNT